MVYRVRIRRGGRKSSVPKGIVYVKPTNQCVTQLKFQCNKRSVAEERAGQKLGGLKVPNLSGSMRKEIQRPSLKGTFESQGVPFSQGNLEEEQYSLPNLPSQPATLLTWFTLSLYLVRSILL